MSSATDCRSVRSTPLGTAETAAQPYQRLLEAVPRLAIAMFAPEQAGQAARATARQIITKAVGADNINRKAVMTAAGGNGGGQGGQIEVSGHDVLLSGNIDPGAGGTLIADPYNAIITPTKGFNDVAGSMISEAFISKQFRHNVAVDIQASHDIVFAAAGNSHVLVGGKGNLTLDAANDIIFNANDYVIETRRGAVTLTAGGDIGDPIHRLSVVSGDGNHGPGVNTAGDILLTAGNDIYVDTITATASRKGKVTASFSANAGGDFSAAGLIDVEAVAQGKGSQQASADIHITAGNDIILHGLTDLASVQSRGKGGNLSAIGGVDLTGNIVTETGNVTVQATVAGRSGPFGVDRREPGRRGCERRDLPRSPDQWQRGRGSAGRPLQRRLGRSSCNDGHGRRQSDGQRGRQCRGPGQ